MAKEQDALIEEWKTKIMANSKEIDPNNEYDWWDLARGWALGKGLNVKDAMELARRIYRENLL